METDALLAAALSLIVRLALRGWQLYRERRGNSNARTVPGVAGGMNKRGADLPAFIREASAARAAERARAFAWVEGREGEPGPWPGVLIRWERTEGGWVALIAFVVTDSGGTPRLAVEHVAAQRLRPRGE